MGDSLHEGHRCESCLITGGVGNVVKEVQPSSGTEVCGLEWFG